MFQENNNAIYMQIARRICDDILACRLKAEDRLPSVREYGALVQVNPNTVMRTYDVLARREIIYNRRGIGFFVSPDAREKIHHERSAQFLEQELPAVFNQLRLLEITPGQLQQLYSKYLDNPSANP